jgi:hypothetical protein
MEDETRLLIGFCFAVLCFSGLCLKGCQTVYEKDTEVVVTAMNKGYVQTVNPGSSTPVWTKKTAVEEAGLLHTTSAMPKLPEQNIIEPATSAALGPQK